MAKLLSYYCLCPLIDTKNLLGISEDVETGVVIVTLGKNIAIKYRVSDQKQLCSWRTKEKFSSQVVFDKNLQKYVAVFNQNFIRVWGDEEESLDKVKKYKFKQSIYTIVSHNQETFVVFKKGSVYSLSEVLEDRKNFMAAAITELAEIKDFRYISIGNNLYSGFLSKTKNTYTFHWTVYNKFSKNVFTKTNFLVENEELCSWELIISKMNCVNLLTVWSDGKMFLKPLEYEEKPDQKDLFTVIESISAQHSIKIIPLDDNYIAIYGSDPNEEGAVLLIYNTQFKVIQSKQIHKLYSEDAKIWKMFNYILLPVGQNLVVVPFCLESEQLVALIGSHKSMQNKIDSDIALVTEYEVGDWSEEPNKKKIGKVKHKFSLLGNRVEELIRDGHSEATIVEQVIPEILEQNNISLLASALDFFKDIPEKFVASILKNILACNAKQFPTSNKVDQFKNLPKCLLPTERVELLDKILTQNFSETILLPHLKLNLSLDGAILLLQYIIYELSPDGHKLPSMKITETEQCLIKWASLIIDANYQKFILSKDEKIEELLVKCKIIVADHLDILEELKGVVPVLTKFQSLKEGKSFIGGGLADCLYSVEIVEY
ncbi:nucleolar protein 11 [Euwallacea fornicatus]|uniref:nucleolar protein 11 n=1 Tax=Euwallacea fornicatus TaxID=995702 RepID=UPI00338E6568